MSDRTFDTCWSRKTPFQAGLLLTLCVSIPFFIAIVYLYIFSTTVFNESESCERLCKLLVKWKDTRNPRDPTDYPDYGMPKSRPRHRPRPHQNNQGKQKQIEILNPPATPGPSQRELKILLESLLLQIRKQIPETRRHKKTTEQKNESLYSISQNMINPFNSNETLSSKPRKRSFDNLSTIEESCFQEGVLFPYIGALLENLYSDNQTDRIFKCPVVVISNEWVLTIAECVQNDPKWIYVRLNSNYWSKGGVVKKVEKIIKWMGFVVLLLDSPQSECFKPVKLSSRTGSKAQSLFWNGDIKRPLKERKKIEKIQTTEVTLKKSRGQCRNETGQIGAPLVDKNHNFIGFQLSSCGRKVAYRDVEDFLELVKKMLIFNV